MQKFICALLALCLMLSLAACGGKTETSARLSAGEIATILSNAESAEDYKKLIDQMEGSYTDDEPITFEGETITLAEIKEMYELFVAIEDIDFGDEDSDSAGDAETETPAGASETMIWGDWSVTVPGGFTLKGGDMWDEEDTRYFSVKKSDFSYFDFKADDEDSIMNNYNYNKETYTNEQEDVQASYGGLDWVGFQYSDGYGGYGFEAYATVGGKLIRVSSAGFTFDSAIAEEVLGSLAYSGS